MTAGLTSGQVIDGTRITYMQLHRWADVEAVRPSIRDARGTGTDRLWSTQDRARLRTIADVLDDLAELGIPSVPAAFVRGLWDAQVDGVGLVRVGAVSVRLGLEDL